MLQRLSNDFLEMSELVVFLLKYGKILRSDSWAEYFGSTVRSVRDEWLIKQDFTPVQSPQ